MKGLPLILIFVTFSLAGRAQTRPLENDTTIYTGYRLKTDTVDKNFVEIDGPSPIFDSGFGYPSGIKNSVEFNNYLIKSIKYPPGTWNPLAKGRIIITFVVEKDGSTSNVKLAVGVGDDRINQEALRAIKTLPKWTAPVYKGKPVRLSYTVPILVNSEN